MYDRLYLSNYLYIQTIKDKENDTGKQVMC